MVLTSPLVFGTRSLEDKGSRDRTFLQGGTSLSWGNSSTVNLSAFLRSVSYVLPFLSHPSPGPSGTQLSPVQSHRPRTTPTTPLPLPTPVPSPHLTGDARTVRPLPRPGRHNTDGVVPDGPQVTPVDGRLQYPVSSGCFHGLFVGNPLSRFEMLGSLFRLTTEGRDVSHDPRTTTVVRRTCRLF